MSKSRLRRFSHLRSVNLVKKNNRSKNPLIIVTSIIILFCLALLYQSDFLLVKSKFHDFKSGVRAIDGTVIDIVDKENLLVIDCKDVGELRFQLDEVKIIDQNNMVSDTNILKVGVIVKVQGIFKDKKLVNLDYIKLVSVPQLSILTMDNNAIVNTHFLIGGNTDRSGNKIKLNLINKRTKETLFEQEMQPDCAKESQLCHYQFPVSLSPLMQNLRNEDKMEVSLSLFQDNNKISSAKINLTLSLRSLRNVSIYYPKTGDKVCQRVNPVKVDIQENSNLFDFIWESLIRLDEKVKNRNYITYIKPELKILNKEFNNGILTFNFDGSHTIIDNCHIAGMYQQLVSTFSQFEEIKKIEILVDGQSDNYINQALQTSRY